MERLRMNKSNGTGREDPFTHPMETGPRVFVIIQIPHRSSNQIEAHGFVKKNTRGDSADCRSAK